MIIYISYSSEVSSKFIMIDSTKSSMTTSHFASLSCLCKTNCIFPFLNCKCIQWQICKLFEEAIFKEICFEISKIKFYWLGFIMTTLWPCSFPIFPIKYLKISSQLNIWYWKSGKSRDIWRYTKKIWYSA